ncbi:MAG: hypothetical protein IKU34_04295 [Clostridia bacterium]|nr:hypothetical protein [Clostridia bacterium]
MDADEMRRLTDAICTVRCGAAHSEVELHELVKDALERAGFCPVHEARIAPRCRIDFLVGDLGIEIKKSRPDPARLIRQLTRYAACREIAQLLVIAPRGVTLPKAIGGKPVGQIALERLWGISLP